MKWTNKIMHGTYKGLKSGKGTVCKEFMLDVDKNITPKVHWCMELQQWKGEPYVRVQCQTSCTRFMMTLEDYNIPIEYKCKNCHKQWVKTKDVIENVEKYKFYNMGGMKIFLCDTIMTGFSNFDIDYIYMSNENNSENWTEEITHAFNKRISCRDLMNLDKIKESRKNMKFWKRYYKFTKA